MNDNLCTQPTLGHTPCYDVANYCPMWMMGPPATKKEYGNSGIVVTTYPNPVYGFVDGWAVLHIMSVRCLESWVACDSNC